MRVVLQVVRAASVATVVHSSMLATAATGGALQSTVLRSPGTATCTTPMAAYSGTATVREMGSRFVALGINLFGLFDYLTAQRSKKL